MDEQDLARRVVQRLRGETPPPSGALLQLCEHYGINPVSVVDSAPYLSVQHVPDGETFEAIIHRLAQVGGFIPSKTYVGWSPDEWDNA